MLEQLENDFKAKVGSLKGKTNVLHFSTGADSVACFLKLRENGIEPILVYKYFIKDLPMVKNYIDYFEKKFNVHVYQFPSTLWAEHNDKVLYQLPIKAREKHFHNLSDYYLDFYSKEFFDKTIAEALGGDVVFHLGLRYTDGLRRYQHLMKHGVSFGNKFYPIASFKVADIYDLLDKYDCKLPIEYGLWGISFESPRSFNINLIKEHCPATYEAIRKQFPLIGALGYREKYTKLNQHFKSRLTQFKRFAMPKEGYDVW